MSKKDVKNLPAGLLFGAAAIFCALGLAGCEGNNPTGGGGGATSALSEGNSPVTMANLEGLMVEVAGGTFNMGCRPEFEEKPFWVNANGIDTGGTAIGNSTCWPHTPKDTVISTFYICKFEVTQGLWKEVLRTSQTPSKFKGDDLPVTDVTGYNIWAFIDTLNSKSVKYTYRLPSENEWEYAARGGAESQGHRFSGSQTASAAAWLGDSVGNKGPHPVGKLPPNELGLHDMSGNVWEMAVFPTPERGSYYSERGGSWYGKENYCSVTYRSRLAGDRGASGLSDRGFRLAAVLK